jgi:AcrR family transcriptional regulator
MPEAGLAETPPRTLPRGRHAAPREVVHASQRQRLLEAMIAAVADDGYGPVAVADVIERAGVSRRTFYEHFVDKQHCFLAAYDREVGRVLDAIDHAIAAASDPLAAAAAGIRAYLEVLAAHPDAARVFLIEVLAAGPAALAARGEVHERFAGQLATVHRRARRQFPDLPAPRRHRLRACVGAIDALVTEHVRRDGAATLPRLSAPLVDVTLGLLVGDERTSRLREELQR